MIEKLPPLNPYDARIVMQDQYEQRYGIFNHRASKDRPLASVAMHPCEDSLQNSLLYEACEEYASLNYRETWGLSLTEFLNQPRYVVEMMKAITTDVIKKKALAVDEFNKKPKS